MSSLFRKLDKTPDVLDYSYIRFNNINYTTSNVISLEILRNTPYLTNRYSFTHNTYNLDKDTLCLTTIILITVVVAVPWVTITSPFYGDALPIAARKMCGIVTTLNKKYFMVLYF